MERITITIDRKTGRGVIVDSQDTRTVTVHVVATEMILDDDTVKITVMPSAPPRAEPK